MAHAWKACWVQALAGSNPASSAVNLDFLAVAVGFEPTENSRPHTLSRRAPLAARTRHRVNRTASKLNLFFWFETCSILQIRL
jgi:hypothetical protein